ncbi:unnamed protein product [Candidula unifasciata]|uniref:Glycerol kinase 5 n=1 Tax=Candidula unifasciata TaxID=100452 RepID=A0A8S3YL99_9EUPU|nr:unnamed protein product [Candidula unifasciata]
MDEGAGDTPQLEPVGNEPDLNAFPALLLNNAPLSEGEVNATTPSMVEQFILSIDIGTTNLRGHVYSKSASLKGSISKQHQILQPLPGWRELDPHRLLTDVCAVAQDSIKAAGLRPQQITCMGITTMRATFVTWDRETGEPFHNLITWQDLRAADYVSIWNKSYTLRALNTGAKILHALMRKKRHLAASVLKFMSKQVTMRLLWVFDNIPAIRERAALGQVMFGCTESWILWNLTGKKSHVTDYSCASSTGLFDPFQMEWSTIVCGLLNIPMSIFPQILDTSGSFGVTDATVIGFEVPITAVVADQQSSMFGHCCFDVGDVKCTMGTGTFLDLNTGSKPHASIAGLYPLIGWKIRDELVFLAEGQSADTGIVLEWAKTLGLIADPAESSSLAESVADSGGVFFVPAFSGLQAPFNDDRAVTAIFGVTPSTTKAHLVRSMLESLAFRFKSLYETALTETRIPLSHVRVDGGVARNDFLVQLMSDTVNQVIDRSQHSDMSCLGAAFLAGLAAGVWCSKEELRALRQSDRQFEPRHNWSQVKVLYHQWENAVHRSQNWYPSS